MPASRSTFLAAALAAPFARFEDDFARIERSTGGRLGIMAIDLQTGAISRRREHERFAMCSTFKLLLVARVLNRVDRGEESLQREVRYGKADLLAYAPVTSAHVAQGRLSIAMLCAAAIEHSDNTAANLLLDTAGGPAGVTQWLRGLGDTVTNLNRREPFLNTAIPGDPRDTTTPAAMARNVQRFLLDGTLSASSAALLAAWMKRCDTGTTLLRAGVPHDWIVGDKTGSGGAENRYGDSSTRNDVAIAWRPERKPVIMVCFLTGSELPAAQRDAAIAKAGRLIAISFAR